MPVVRDELLAQRGELCLTCCFCIWRVGWVVRRSGGTKWRSECMAMSPWQKDCEGGRPPGTHVLRWRPDRQVGIKKEAQTRSVSSTRLRYYGSEETQPT
jgi:hypothetical protein